MVIDDFLQELWWIIHVQVCDAIVEPLLHNFMIRSFNQVTFQRLLTCSKHILDALAEKVFNQNSFALWVIEMELGDLLDNFALVVSH